MGTINSSMQAVQQAQADLGYVDNPPPLGHDLVIPFFQNFKQRLQCNFIFFIFKVEFRILNRLLDSSKSGTSQLHTGKLR